MSNGVRLETGSQGRIGTTFDTFWRSARTGRLSAAAEQLVSEHTTVARRIQALEDEPNSRLFLASAAAATVDRGE
jgi:DNA-binding transcriptional LysR family regulator